MKQGTSANHSGAMVEETVHNVLRNKGYCIKTHYPICDSIYGHPIRIDLYLTNVQGYPTGLAIEVKWQDVGGSVDEKFPYLIANIRDQFPCPTIIVVDGRGQKPGAVAWLRAQVDGVKLIGVFDIAEFISWSRRAMPPAVVEQGQEVSL